MGFRKPKTERHKEHAAWHAWIEQHGSALKSMGLPADVYLTLDHWQDFLENGQLHWHEEDTTGFEFSQLAKNQMERLRSFLEENREFRPEYFPLLEWLRIRLDPSENW